MDGLSGRGATIRSGGNGPPAASGGGAASVAVDALRIRRRPEQGVTGAPDDAVALAQAALSKPGRSVTSMQPRS